MLAFESLANLKIAMATPHSETELEIIESSNCDLIEIDQSTTIPKDTLISRGYTLRPRKITYKLNVPQNIDSYIALLSPGRRKRIAKAARELPVKIFTEEPVSYKTYNAWEKVYDKNIASKRIGIKRATKERFKVVQPHSAGVFAQIDGTIVGGILLTKKRFLLEGALREKLSISHSSSSRIVKRLSDLLNLEVVSFARKKGYDYLERGFDTNLYGHYLSPGLYLFKKSLGYRISAKARFGNAWTKIIRYDKFSDVIFFVSHGTNGLVGNLLYKGSRPRIEDFKSIYLEKLKIKRIRESPIKTTS